MKQGWTLAALTVFATAITAAGTTTADAAAKPTTADAAAKTKVKTFVETDKVRLTGIGAAKGWAYKDDFTHKAVLSPKLGVEVSGHWSNTYQHQSGRWHFILGTGTTTGYRSDNGGAWKAFPYTAKQLAELKAATDPMRIPSLMTKLKVDHRVSKRHWRATGTLAQLRGFIDHELPLSTATLKQHGYKRMTLNLWVDSKGRPTKITLTGKARYEKASITETFAKYDKKLVIVAPQVPAALSGLPAARADHPEFPTSRGH